MTVPGKCNTLKARPLWVLMASVLSVVTSTPMFAQASFNGTWKVLLRPKPTQECKESEASFLIRIRAGKISSGQQDSALILVGRVDRDGNAKVATKTENERDRASGEGKLSDDSGKGSWKAVARHCEGTWVAEKVR